jgi:hypothetical protein
LTQASRERLACAREQATIGDEGNPSMEGKPEILTFIIADTMDGARRRYLTLSEQL